MMSAEGSESRINPGKLVLGAMVTGICGLLFALFQAKAEHAGRMDNLENRVAAHEGLGLSALCKQVERLEGRSDERLTHARSALEAQVVALAERVQQVESRPVPSGLEPETPASIAQLRSDLDRIRESLALLGPLSERVSALERAAGAAPRPESDPTVRGALAEQEAGLAKLKSRLDGVATREALEALTQRVAQLAQQIAQVAAMRAAPSGGTSPAPAMPVPQGAPAAGSAVLQSQRKGGVRLDITSMTADGAHVIVEFLATSERRDARLRLSGPRADGTRAITAQGVQLARGAFTSPRNDYRGAELQLVADVPTRGTLYLECTQAAPVHCSALVVGMQVDAGPPGWPDEFVDHEITFRNVVAGQP
jgi:hypothetical protein